MGALVFIAVAAASTPIVGNSICPRPAQVQAQLAPLVRDRAFPEGASVRLSQSPSTVHLEWLQDGEVRARRSLSARATCDALASACAVVIATWLSQLSLSEPVVTPLTPTRPAPPPESAPPTSGRSAWVELAVGITGSWDGRALAVGVQADILALRVSSPLGASLAVAMTGERASWTADGKLTTNRFLAGLGPQWRLDWPSTHLDLRALGLLALFSRVGDDSPKADLLRLQPGLSLGIRASMSSGPWVGAWLCGYLPQDTRASALEAFLGLGLAFGS